MAAAGMVIVGIISFFWSLKLRTREASRALPPPPLPALYPDQEEDSRLDNFLSVASQLCASLTLSWSPNSEKDWFMGLGDQGQDLWVGATLPFRAQARFRRY